MSDRFAKVVVPAAATRALLGLVAVGLAAFGLGLYTTPHRAWASLLGASYLLLELSLAALFFIAIHYVTGAKWHVTIRRVPEAMALLLPLGAVGLLVVLVAHPSLYPWFLDPPEAPRALLLRRVWLSRPFFLARSVAYLACWALFAVSLVRRSYRQDDSGDPALTDRNVAVSAWFLVALGLTLVPASFDWIMSLEPEWYSTIFGFYDFAGMFLSGLAAIIVLVLWVRRLAAAHFTVGDNQLRDLGTLLFAFSTFWAYIWFCQYMLIWYANLPEETSYFVTRQHNAWGVLFLLNPALNWGVPFLVLLSRDAKRRPARLLVAAGSVLGGRLLDVYLAIVPGFAPAPTAGVPEIGLALGGMALFTLAFFQMLQRAPLVPRHDPSGSTGRASEH
jgi:hypothetical protein